MNEVTLIKKYLAPLTSGFKESLSLEDDAAFLKKNNKTKYFSYKFGAKKLIDLSKFIFDNYDINFVSAFALSKHNIKRGSYLQNIIKRVLRDFLDQDSHKNNYNFNLSQK